MVPENFDTEDEAQNVPRESLGDFLRRHREASSKTLEAISRNTRISKRFLQAFEDNDLANLPEDAFARGFLRSYAVEVGLDVEDCLGRYDRFRRSMLPTQVREIRKTKAMTLGDDANSPTIRPNRATMILLASGVAVVVLAMILLFALHSFKSSSVSVGPTNSNGASTATAPEESAPPINEQAKPATPATGTPEVAKAPDAQAVKPPPAMATPIKPSILTITAKKDAKISVRLDENAIQEIVLKQGESQVLNVFREIEIRAPDKAALNLQYNSKPLEVSGPVIKLFNRYLFQKK